MNIVKWLACFAAAVVLVVWRIDLDTADAATGTPDTRPRAVSFCNSEADDRGPCVYDPQWAGNGTGRPYVLHSDGRVRYLSPPLPSRPGDILTSKGRITRVQSKGAHAGCLWLTYAEQGYPRAGDPRDGEWFCAR